MSKKRFLFIVNPISGIGKQKDIPKIIDRYFDSHTGDYQIEVTKYAGHAREIAREAQGNYDVLVAVGGDGTMNETASQLIGSDTALGIIPLGSGNGFARHLGLSTDPVQAVQQLNRAEPIPLDACYMNERPFFNVSGMGFDAQVSKRFMLQIKRGYATYARCVWAEFQTYRPRRYRYELNGKLIEERLLMIAFANTQQYGNNAVIAPQARIDDGYVDVVFVHPFPLAYLPIFTMLAFTRNIHHSPYVKIARVQQFHIQQMDETLGHVDGDYVETEAEVQLEVQSNSLHVLRPAIKTRW
ncbi:MAG: diacylglycerol kinase family protein [Tunicatimonas sp.]